MIKDLEGKVALVTGATSGIGKAIAVLYAQQGASVMLSGRNVTLGEQAVEEIVAAGGTARFYKADVGDPVQCRELVQETASVFGRLDIACNNAGISGGLNPVADYPLEDWHDVININLNSVFYCLKYELEVMIQQNTPCAVVNMSSILGQVGTPYLASYVAAKHGVVGLTKTAALEYAAQDIRINVVGPAYVDTPLLDVLPADAKDALGALHPIGRLGRVEEVAELVLWLSSGKSSFITGAYYAMDGGYLAK